MLEVDETFTTIWLLRSSEVRVKVRRWPQSPVGTIFCAYRFRSLNGTTKRLKLILIWYWKTIIINRLSLLQQLSLSTVRSSSHLRSVDTLLAVCAVCWCEGAFTRDGLPVMTYYITGIGIIYILALIVRGMQHVLVLVCLCVSLCLCVFVLGLPYATVSPDTSSFWASVRAGFQKLAVCQVFAPIHKYAWKLRPYSVRTSLRLLDVFSSLFKQC